MKILFLVMCLFLASACGDDKNTLYVYTGRKAKYAKALFEGFTKKTGIKIKIKQDKTSMLANTIIKEGKNSPADIFFAQDSSNLGALSAAGFLEELPKATSELLDARYRSAKNDWVGTSARARVFVYNKNLVKAGDLPESIFDLTKPKWKGKLGWAPENASFQSHVTAMIKVEGKEKTAAWIKGLIANDIKTYPKNTPIVIAVAEGKIAAGLVNHYYLYKVRKDMKEAEQVENHFFANGDAGMFVNISGVAILKTSKKKEMAQIFIDYLLSQEGQQSFRTVNFEYPVTKGVEAAKDLKPLSEINPVKVDLGDLDKVEETVKLLEDCGAFE